MARPLDEMGAPYEPVAAPSLKDALYQWISHVKLSRIIWLVFAILVLVTFVSYNYLPKVIFDDLLFVLFFSWIESISALLQVESNTPNADIHLTRNKLEAFEDFSSLTAADLKLRIDEMTRIKGSVSTELRDLEAKRQRLQQELSSQGTKIESLKSELLRYQTELDRLKISVEQVVIMK